MEYRTARTLHVALMIWISLLFLGAWLPLIRSLMDGESYRWGARLLGQQFGGTGLSGDFWFPLVKVGIGLALLWFGWRRPNGKVRIALAAYLALIFVDTLYNVLTIPEAFRAGGVALGVELSLVWLAPVLDAAFLLLGLWWALRAPELATPPLVLTNRILIGAAVLLLPVQYYLLAAAGQASDALGVLLAMVGWGLFSAGLAPWGGKDAAVAEEGATQHS